MKGRLALVLVVGLAVSACAATSNPANTTPPATNAPATSVGGGSTPTAGPTAEATPSKAPVATAASGTCIISAPAQVGTDMTPIIMVYQHTDAATCQAYLDKQNKGATGWAADHPATIVTTMPSGTPACSGSMQGIDVAIYGTSAAKYACTALGLS